MSETKLENFKNAVERLNEAVQLYKKVTLAELKDACRDSLIKRYEMAFELSWKTLADFLESKFVRLEFRTPQAIFKEAHCAGYIKNEAPWVAMLKRRNDLVHNDNNIAKIYTPALNDLLKIILQNK